MHYKLGILYLSDTNGAIRFLQASKKINRVLPTVGMFKGYPIGLSVDWLFDKLYIVIKLETTGMEKWQVWKSGLFGEDLKMVYGDLLYEPKHLHADPSNG